MSYQNSLEAHFSTKDRAYTGKELRPHFLLTELGLRGSGIGAFVGPCRVETEHLVDWEDRLAEDRIEAARMVHFIGEFFGMGLREGVLLQRLFMASLGDSLNVLLPEANRLRREGDDLFVAERKLSVSIVTASPVSVLLHTGINVDPTGAPVPAIGLSELDVDPQSWAMTFLDGFAAEWASIQWACAKVRPVV
ncbi:MAG: hypothetical protein A2X94_07815 [Bdellovibrionales bacterium GWB1_55_8]|nr:MAG: hypothetical protein A2X94_07815 [Bdellovibrionales bacterium GWB1_55_8]